MVGASDDHSAAGSALGYLYQCYWPLLELVRRSNAEPGLSVALELLDDVQFEEQGRPLELIQTKHHGTRGDLGDTSVDLWRTINVWISAIEQLGLEESVSLTLATTATAGEGTAASYLSADNERDEGRAQTLLENAARSSVNTTTSAARSRFLNLLPTARRELVRAITVADGALRIEDLDRELQDALFWALPGDERLPTFVEYLRGWWHGIAIRLLRRELERFTVIDLLQQVRDLQDQFGPESLPTDPDLPDPDEATVAEYQDRIFVRQLALIAANQRQLAIAIKDYYRAFTQRSRWLRRELLGVGELDRFERQLVDEWEFVFTNLAREMSEEASDEEQERCGREILGHLAENAKARIRERYNEPFMLRGTLHELADGRRVGWHPDFEARLEALLGPVVDGA